jgi:hypothetical protein
MASGSGMTFTSDTLTPRLRDLPGKVDEAVAKTVAYFRPTVEGYARINAKWTDQTGNARQGLRATEEHIPRVRHSIVLSHSVPYGIWLEVRFEGRYAVIEPTIRVQGPLVMATLAGLLGRIRR